MDLEAIEKTLKDSLSDCQVELVAEGNKLMVQLVSDDFAGLNRVKRQQKVYGLLDDRIKSGEIHAVSMVTLTKEESSSKD